MGASMKALNITPLEPTKALKTQVYEALKEIIGHMDIYSGEELRPFGKRYRVSSKKVLCETLRAEAPSWCAKPRKKFST